MPTVTEVRDQLADIITDHAGLRAVPLVQETMIPPIAIVTRRAFDPRLVFTQSKAAYLFTVTIYVDRTVERSAQIKLDEYCELSGNDSVTAAIQNGANWTLAVDYAQVTQIGEVQAVAIAESNYLAVALDVEVVF